MPAKGGSLKEHRRGASSPSRSGCASLSVLRRVAALGQPLGVAARDRRRRAARARPVSAGLGGRCRCVGAIVGALVGNADARRSAALIGADGRVPTMVLLRAPLGRRGSYLPTGLNILQCLGWSIFELIVIATGASALSRNGSSASGALAVDARLRRRLARAWAARPDRLRPPLPAQVRGLDRARVAGLPLVVVACKVDLHHYWNAPGKGGFPHFGQAVDLVIGEHRLLDAARRRLHPLLPRSPRRGFGAGLGYFLPTIPLFALGALLVLGRGHLSDAQAIPTAVAAGGAVALVALALITSTRATKAFANVYSAAVSHPEPPPADPAAAAHRPRRRRSRPPARILINLRHYQQLPLPARLVLRAALRRPLRRLARLRCALRRPSASSRARSSAVGPFVAWLAGFALYQWLSPDGPGWWTRLVEHTHPPRVTFTASLPSFAASFGDRPGPPWSRRSVAEEVHTRGRVIALLGNLSHDFFPGQPPRPGGGPFHAARALQRLDARCGDLRPLRRRGPRRARAGRGRLRHAGGVRAREADDGVRPHLHRRRARDVRSRGRRHLATGRRAAAFAGDELGACRSARCGPTSRHATLAAVAAGTQRLLDAHGLVRVPGMARCSSTPTTTPSCSGTSRR